MREVARLAREICHPNVNALKTDDDSVAKRMKSVLAGWPASTIDEIFQNSMSLRRIADIAKTKLRTANERVEFCENFMTLHSAIVNNYNLRAGTEIRAAEIIGVAYGTFANTSEIRNGFRCAKNSSSGSALVHA